MFSSVSPPTLKEAPGRHPGSKTALLVSTVPTGFTYHMTYVLNFITNAPFACKIVTKLRLVTLY
jgi:hypothetical protein